MDTVGNNEKQTDTAGNTKGSKASRLWCITINNPNDLDIFVLEQQERYIYQIETGETGTDHIQGYVEYTNPRRFETMKKKFPRAHLEMARNRENAIAYCQKKETRKKGPFSNFVAILMDNYSVEKAKKWQIEILEKIKKTADNRVINWYWEETGNVGKTTLAKHICIENDDAIYVGGKSADVKNAIASMKKKPRIVIWDVPRTVENYVSYAAIEEVKNGIFFSGKYESGMVMFNSPHIIIFANFEPDTSTMSEDRWNIVKIE